MVGFEVRREERRGLGFGEREGIGDFGTASFLAKVAVAYGGEADWVWFRTGNKAFELFDKGKCSGVDVGGSAATAGGRGKAAFEIGGTRAEA